VHLALTFIIDQNLKNDVLDTYYPLRSSCSTHTDKRL